MFPLMIFLAIPLSLPSNAFLTSGRICRAVLTSPEDVSHLSARLTVSSGSRLLVNGKTPLCRGGQHEPSRYVTGSVAEGSSRRPYLNIAYRQQPVLKQSRAFES